MSETTHSRGCCPSDLKTKPIPFSCMFLGVAAFSWPFRVALNNYSFIRFISLFKTSSLQMSTLLSQLEGVPSDETVSTHQKSVRDSSENVGSNWTSSWNDYEYSEEEGECDEGLFVCGKHIQEGASDEGETDSEEDEETCDNSDILWVTNLCLEDSGSMPVCPTLSIENDDDDFIVFSDTCPEEIDTKLSCIRTDQAVPSQVHSLLHTSSYSSDESGYCENMATDSSGDESEDNEDCVMDEGLWQEVEEQAHFFVGTEPLRKPATPSPIADNKIIATDRFHHESVNVSHPVLAADHTAHNSEDAAIVSSLDLCSSPPPHKAQKSVSFKPESELVQVHVMVTWQFAYRSCRRGPWEQFARDRDRFRMRIENTAKILNPCLKKRSI